MVNTLGAVCVFDGEVPRTFTGKARTAISGGQLVVVSGAANCVGSGVSSYVASDIELDLIANGDYCNGIALNNADSGAYVAVATRGSYLMRSAGVISGGQTVCPFSGTLQGVIANGISGTAAANLGTVIGRAQSASASGTALYALVSLNL
jgi:hypothetical protein